MEIFFSASNLVSKFGQLSTNGPFGLKKTYQGYYLGWLHFIAEIHGTNSFLNEMEATLGVFGLNPLKRSFWACHFFVLQP